MSDDEQLITVGLIMRGFKVVAVLVVLYSVAKKRGNRKEGERGDVPFSVYQPYRIPVELTLIDIFL